MKNKPHVFIFENASNETNIKVSTRFNGTKKLLDQGLITLAEAQFSYCAWLIENHGREKAFKFFKNTVGDFNS